MGLEPPGFGDYETFWKTSHPQDPRTPDEPDRYSWEETIAYTEILDDLTISEVLAELLHGSADRAKRVLDAAVAVEFMLYQQRMKRHDFETRGEPA